MKYLIRGLFPLIFSASLMAQDFTLQKMTSGLGVIWGMTFVTDKEILYTQRDGRAGIVDIESGGQRDVAGLPSVMAEGQGGLMDVATAPDFQPGGWIYFTYSKPMRDGGATTLARARLADDRLIDWSDLLVTHSVTDTGRHYGSRIAFDDQGYLYFGVGDRGHRPNGQDLSTHAGSVLRLHRDGSIPEDNPFVGNNDALPEIWSYGHRNPQGLTFDPVYGRLWEIEHGPRGGDEINLVEKGRNYGWPVISYGKEYWGPLAVGEDTQRAGMEQPVKYFVPSIAPSSLIVYQGDQFPEWKGALLSGALKLRHLNIVKVDAEGNAVAEDRVLEDLGERIRSLAQDRNGYIYFATDSGKIFRMVPAN